MKSRSLTARFLRSRILPGAAVLALIAGWVSVTGSLFWRARVKEEFSLMGTLTADPSGGDRVSLLPVRWLGRPPAAIDAGREITIAIQRGDGRRDSFRATLIEPGGELANGRLILGLSPANATTGELPGLAAGGQPVRIDLVLRQKRLLVAALEKAPLIGNAVAR
jgi:hypothetical protein